MGPSSLLDTNVTYFLAVVEEGGFSAAARRLHLSQPSLSVAVKKLEEAVGAQLLHRGPRGATVTAAGAVLLARARDAARSMAAARDEIDGLGREPRGRFVLGCHESLGTYFLPGFMARFVERKPKIEIDLTNRNSREVEAAVVAREIDVGLVVNPASHPDCVVRELFFDRVGLVTASKLRRKVRSTAKLLADTPLILVPELRQSQAIIGELEGRGLQTGRQIRCSSMELVKSLVLDGAGVGILPHRVATHGVAGGRLSPLGSAMPTYDDRITLVWRDDHPMTVGLRTLLDALLAHGGAFPPLPH